MIGSNGPRMLRSRCRAPDAWNTWWEDYHNDAEGLATLIDEIGIPKTVSRSVCMLVQLDGMPVERRRRSPRLSRHASPSTSGNWVRPAPTR